MKIPAIYGIHGNFVVVSQIAAAICKNGNYEIILINSTKILLEESDGKTEANLKGQLDMYFNS